MTWFRRLVFVALFVLFIPFFIMLIIAGISQLFGCAISEGGGTCLILGADFGSSLSALSVLGWFMLITLPIAACVFVFWLLVEIVVWMRARRA
ncbi:MAG: hypothetical protein ABJN57_05470 [Hyphomicrobiales bacterium]